jgi:UDP-N-acetylglucosamine--N-acetylmuramyl-(pentapeptide) pyrophosphoryl-undecaprenol N-acetylglucosamine transferase
VRLLICAGGTGGGVYPALAVLERLIAEHQNVQTLWIGGEGGMERDLVAKAGVDYKSIPAAGVHGVGIRRLPGNVIRVIRGITAARNVLRQFQPDVLFFTGGYVAVPIALAGLHIPTLLYVPDIEPGIALKFLARFADTITLTAEESTAYLPDRKEKIVTGYPVRKGLSTWKVEDAYKTFDFRNDLPTLLVTGGSLGSLALNNALIEVLPTLLIEMQIIHLTGELTWSKFEHVSGGLSPEGAKRYRSYPYLHERMGAAFSIADLIISRAGASSIGEYPHFGLPAILAPYPYAWRYQHVNAKYLARKNAAVILNDAEMPTKLLPLVLDLMRDPVRRSEMKDAMRRLARHNSASSIANLIAETAAHKYRVK